MKNGSSGARMSKARQRKRIRRRAAGVSVVGSPLQMYLNEIGKDLLTAEEEIDLAMKIEAGVQAARRLVEAEEAGIELERRELRRLTRVEQVGLDARRQLIEANLRLVVSIAKRYVNNGIPLADLIQEGNLGLMRTADKFDYTRGNRFSTYATWWIRQGITRAIADQSRTIRLPVHMNEMVVKIMRIQHHFFQATGREATPEDISEALVADGVKEEAFTPGKVRDLLQVIEREPRSSLDTPVGEDGDSVYGDFVEDDSAEDPFASAALAMLEDVVLKALECLEERERIVIRLRYGLDGHLPCTLEAIGSELGITRERVRQIESRALGKLRHPSVSWMFEDCLS